ncbi:MFS multidrug transporter-like protein [Coleophoma cylindrospora]|uniref:MFS multidrug transporter-like protein n=1 Tax=Coleophoma cylindrospora TaxID=1849047 RepID=A0A3D8Q954_9HELO|nr:MFS multidrug transporter-like protein [Coleophoma cylindrospora]
MDGPALPKWRLLVLITRQVQLEDDGSTNTDSLYSLCAGLFLSLIDTTIVATALYTIGVDFKNLNGVAWVALAYTLSYLGCVVIFARLADIIGRQYAYVAASVIFMAFSLGCGFAKSLNTLIICRTFQGIGGSGLYSLTMVIFPEISTLNMRKWIGGVIGAVVAMSGVLGPVLGGVITSKTTWRWIFWINAPIGTIPLILFCIAWPKADQIRHAERRPLKDLDIISSILLIAASVLVVFALQEGGITSNSWGTPLFLVPIIIGIICWISLFGWEYLAHKHWTRLLTMFPFRVMRNRVYSAAAMSTLLTGFSYFVVIYSLPLRFQVVNQKSALDAGVGILPMLGSTAVGSMVGGRLSGNKNRTFQTLFAGSCLMLLGIGLLTTLENTDKVQAKTYGFLVFVGLGFGLTVSTTSLLSAVECELEDAAVGQGIVAQWRMLGGSIGIAASTAILSVTEQVQLNGIVSSSQLASIQHSAALLTAEQLHAVKQAYSDAFREDMQVCAAIAGVCILVALGTWQKSPMTILDRRNQQVINETRRRAAGARRAAAEEKKEPVPVTELV